MRLRQVEGRSQRTQGQDPRHDPPDFGIGGDQALGVQLTQGDVQCPLVGPYLPLAVRRQADAFADADSSGTDEQECIRGQIIGSAELLLQELVVREGKRFGKIARLGRKVLLTNEI